jgi:hypothetical protein
MTGCASNQQIFFSGGIQALVNRWNKRIESNGVYVGK